MKRPVAVFGGGVSGAAASRLIGKLGSDCVVYDRNGTEFTPEAADGHSLAVFSPGFALNHPWLQMARKAGCLCVGELDFASFFWTGRVVAITGTNGKTTLTEFLTHALTRNGVRARAAGNLGYSLSRLAADEDGGAPDMVAVCEVSSFQAEQLGHFQADSLIWTNFAEDHLERHDGMEAYFKAKWALVLRTTAGRFLGGISVAHFGSLYGHPLPPGSSVPTEGLTSDPGLVGTPFEGYPQRENFVLAAAWWAMQGLERSRIYEAAASFRVGRHRMSKVFSSEAVTFWNDSKATNFHAVEAALLGFGAPVVLIAGGRSKGGDIGAFAQRIAPKVAHAVLIGETGPSLAAALSLAGVPCSGAASIEEAVRVAAAVCPRGGDVILSPGFASFDMFRSYEDRGNRFENAVSELFAARV